MMYIDDEANGFIREAVRKQLESQGLSRVKVPQEIVEKILAEHGFRKSGMEIDTHNYANELERKTLPERIWINDNGGCLETENTIRVVCILATRSLSWELPEEDRKKEGLCLTVELEGICRRKDTSGWNMTEECREIMKATIKKGELSVDETLEKIKEEVLLQVSEEEIVRTIKEGKKHRTTSGQSMIGEEIEVLTLPVKIVVST